MRNKATGDYACSYAIPSNFPRMKIARKNGSLWCRLNSVDVWMHGYHMGFAIGETPSPYFEFLFEGWVTLWSWWIIQLCVQCEGSLKTQTNKQTEISCAVLWINRRLCLTFVDWNCLGVFSACNCLGTSFFRSNLNNLCARQRTKVNASRNLSDLIRNVARTISDLVWII